MREFPLVGETIAIQIAAAEQAGVSDVLAREQKGGRLGIEAEVVVGDVRWEGDDSTVNAARAATSRA